MSSQNNTPEGWVETTLGEIAEKMYSGGTPSTIRDDFYGGSIPWIRTQEVVFNFIKETEIKITELCLKNSSARFIPINTVIVAMYGNSAGRVALSKIEATTNQACCNIVTNPQISSPYFIFYNLLGRYKEIESKANGAAQQNLSVGVLKELKMILPLLSEQKSIAAILTAFDDKIELLQAQNKTLEETAQTIFKEWFGKYQIGDELPEGWRVEELGNLLELIIDYRGKTPLKLGLDWSETGIPAISAKSIKNGKIVRRDAMNFGSEELYSIWMKDELKKGDILLTSEAPLGEMYYINNHTKYILSQRVFALRTNLEITSEYLFHYLFSTNGQALLQARASGSTVEGIRQSELRKIDVIVPKKDILDSASKIFKSFFDKIFTNEQQIQSLTQTRDELLPKLMSGEVRVNEFK